MITLLPYLLIAACLLACLGAHAVIYAWEVTMRM